VVSKVSKLKSLRRTAYELVQMGPVQGCVVTVVWALDCAGDKVKIFVEFDTVFGW